MKEGKGLVTNANSPARLASRREEGKKRAIHHSDRIYFLKSAPIPAAKPEKAGVATAIASVGTKTALFPNADTRMTSIRFPAISWANLLWTSPSAFALMRTASASASAARRVAWARAPASMRVRSAAALAAAMMEYASASDSV